MSIAGGVDRAVERGASAGCDAIQIFTKSSNQWRAKPLDDDEVQRFRVGQIEQGVSPVVAHDSYLINLASPDPALYERSIASFGDELDRCERLGMPALVAHPGSHVGSGEEAGIERVAAALNRLLRQRPGQRVKVLLETTAGQGHSLGHRFEHLREILNRLEAPERGGVCFDTCHVFAAGYDLRSEASYHAVMREMDRVIGLSRVGAFHLNDSKKDIGCRVDRHEHIGAGYLGLDAFRWLMNDARFDGIPMFLETPKGEDLAEDRVNLATLRGLVGGRSGGRRQTTRTAPKAGR